MTETKPLPPLEIVGERFTIRHFAGTETLEVAKDVDGDLAFHAGHDGTVVMIAAADVSRFIDALARLTGNGPILMQVAEMIQRARREALEDAAAEVDCGCLHREAVLAAKTKSDRWLDCGEACCGALMARDILSLAEKE